jgi:hypothetical protein
MYTTSSDVTAVRETQYWIDVTSYEMGSCGKKWT